MISLRLLVESLLDEHVLRHILDKTGRYIVDTVVQTGGKAKLKFLAPKYNQAARFYPYIFLVDLDDDECPPALIKDWLPHGKNHNLLLRVAVCEIETWLLADREGLAELHRMKYPTQNRRLSTLPENHLTVRFEKALFPTLKAPAKLAGTITVN